MPTHADPNYATHLAHARIAALKALTDILATSEDSKERRLAATAILRTPDPAPPPAPCPIDHRRNPETLRHGDTQLAAQPTAADSYPPPHNAIATTIDLHRDPGFAASVRPDQLAFRRRSRTTELIAAAGAPS